MNTIADLHHYQIIFPGGKIIYKPLSGIIVDQINNRTIDLPEKRKFSLMSDADEIKNILSSEFSPVCLTIYASHFCNLNCTYCYVPDKDLSPAEFIDPVIVKAGAQLISKNCKERNLPFILGFHGGNEPLLHPKRIEEYIHICKTAAKKNDLELLPFCTTNGVIPENTAKWAADNFHGITLSWDGPPEIHDSYRKDRLKAATSENVIRSAAIFTRTMHDPKMFLIRCTITSSSVEKMEEITTYFKEAGVKNIEFYPVFTDNNHQALQEMVPDSRKFVYYFLKARSYGEKNDVRVRFSGSRLNDMHGRYCMILQDNLTITPDGYLTNCFYHTQNYKNQNNLFFYGKYHSDKNLIVYDKEKLDQIIRKSGTYFSDCTDCFNKFHCSQGCPNTCPLHEKFTASVKPECIKEKWLSLANILEYAGYIRQFNDESALVSFYSEIKYWRI